MLTLPGQQLANTLVRQALSGNRDSGTGGNQANGASGGGDFVNNLKYGGLFSERGGQDANNANKPRVTVSGAGPGGMISNLFHFICSILLLAKAFHCFHKLYCFCRLSNTGTISAAMKWLLTTKLKTKLRPSYLKCYPKLLRIIIIVTECKTK